jgi:hypothetical protein
VGKYLGVGVGLGVGANYLLGVTSGVDILFGSDFGSRFYIVNILPKFSKVLTRFYEAISREPLRLQKLHRRQKMRLILKFCLGFF